MVAWSRLQKLAAVAFGSATGVAFYIYATNRNIPIPVENSWTTNTIVPPDAKWNFNWDHREPTSLVKPNKKTDENELEKYNEKLQAVTPKFVRHLILIRHGQYNQNGDIDSDHNLTELGQIQAKFTGDRLKALGMPYDKLIRSTMTRAQETGKIISNQLAIPSLPVENCSLIEEGAPIAPEPPVGHWRPEPSQFFQDGARIEAGFRKHFYRANAKQEKDTYTIVVCHANVIRYFVCRALQFPPEAWLRLSLNNASITWLSIQPSGRVILRQLGECGHIPPEYITNR